MSVDIVEELMAFSDFIAPTLDVYEQAIYVYVLRHSHLNGSEQVTISLKSDRNRMGYGAGDRSRPMSESTLTKKIRALEVKGLLKKVDSGRTGSTFQVILPMQTDLINTRETPKVMSIEEVDFFSDPQGREAILRREQSRCFYCLSSLVQKNYVMEHVVSRPSGNNSHRNIVAACQSCNNKKSNRPAEDHLRDLWRESKLSEQEFRDRLRVLDDLRAGKLPPDIEGYVYG